MSFACTTLSLDLMAVHVVKSARCGHKVADTYSLRYGPAHSQIQRWWYFIRRDIGQRQTIGIIQPAVPGGSLATPRSPCNCPNPPTPTSTTTTNPLVSLRKEEETATTTTTIPYHQVQVGREKRRRVGNTQAHAGLVSAGRQHRQQQEAGHSGTGGATKRQHIGSDRTFAFTNTLTAVLYQQNSPYACLHSIRRELQANLLGFYSLGFISMFCRGASCGTR